MGVRKIFLAAGVLLLSLGSVGSKEFLPGEILWQEGVGYRAEGLDLQQAGQTQRAITAFHRAVGVNPHYAEVYNDLGVALESVGETAKAEAAYRTALRLKPELAAAHTNLALLYEESGQLQKAAEHWAARVRMGPSDDPWVAKARQKLAGHNLPVPETAETLILTRKDQIHKEIQAGRAHLEAKRWDEAETEFQKALSLDPSNREAARLLRQAQSSAKEYGERTQREMDASRTHVQKELGRIHKEESAQKAEAQRRAEEIRREQNAMPRIQKPRAIPPAPVQIQEVPAPAVPQDALAVAQEYAREKARTHQATVKDLNSRAVGAMREGQYQEAVDAFHQILLLDPSNRDAQRGLERAEKALAKELP